MTDDGLYPEGGSPQGDDGRRTTDHGCRTAAILVLVLTLCAGLACGVKGKPRPPDTRAQIQAALQQISTAEGGDQGTTDRALNSQ